MCALYPKSRVELTESIARHYDILLDLGTLGTYPSVIQSAVRSMEIEPSDKILDLGAGTGRNACLMMEYLSAEGEILGIDISEEMTSQFEKNCADWGNARIINQRIDRPLPYENEFDKVFMCFVLHGFPQRIRIRIIQNAYNALKMNGEFFILDYNSFSLGDMPFLIRIPFKILECPYAFDFIKRDWKGILAEEGFSHFEEKFYYSDYVRLLKAVKES